MAVILVWFSKYLESREGLERLRISPIYLMEAIYMSQQLNGTSSIPAQTSSFMALDMASQVYMHV